MGTNRDFLVHIKLAPHEVVASEEKKEKVLPARGAGKSKVETEAVVEAKEKLRQVEALKPGDWGSIGATFL